MIRFTFTLVLFGVCGLGVVASSVRAQSRASASMERAVNRYRWVAEADVDEALGRWLVDARYTTATDAYLLVGGGASLRDEHRLTWRLARPLTARLGGFATGRSDVFGQSRVFAHTAFLGVSRTFRGALLEPMLGVSVDARPGVRGAAEERAPMRRDAGPAAGARWMLSPRIDAFALDVHGDAAYHSIAPRRAYALRTTAVFQRDQEQAGGLGVELGGQVRVASVRRDVYQSASFFNRLPTEGAGESLEATTSDTLSVGLMLSGRPLTVAGTPVTLRTRLEGDVLRRRIRILRLPEEGLGYDTDFGRRHVDSETSLAWQARRVGIDLVVRAGADVERRSLVNREALPPALASQRGDLLRQADFDRGNLAMRARLRLDATRRLRLNADAGASVTRTDTPEINPDDRDEAAHDAALGISWQLRPALQFGARLAGTYVHTVYLNAERSAENTVQRSLRLAPLVTWTPAPGTRVQFTTEIRATYTEDDVVLPGRAARNQSARELRYRLEGERALPGFQLRASASSSTLLLGQLLPDRFAEVPQDTLRTFGGWLRVQTRGRVRAEVGLRAFVRTDYSRSLSVRYPRPDAAPGIVARPGRTTIRQVGPTTSLQWPLRTFGATLELEGWYVWQHVSNRLYGALPESDADAIREEARRGSRTVLPNLRLGVTYYPKR